MLTLGNRTGALPVRHSSATLAWLPIFAGGDMDWEWIKERIRDFFVEVVGILIVAVGLTCIFGHSSYPMQSFIVALLAATFICKVL